MISAEAAGRPVGPPLTGWQRRFLPDTAWNTSNVNDPWYNAKFEAGGAATTLEEYYSIVKELDQYTIEKFWKTWGGLAPQYVAVQPWLIGFNGETLLGNGQYTTIFSRLWIDQELKSAMGH